MVILNRYSYNTLINFQILVLNFYTDGSILNVTMENIKWIQARNVNDSVLIKKLNIEIILTSNQSRDAIRTIRIFKKYRDCDVTME